MKASYLIQKKGESTYYARIVIPVDIRHAYDGQSTLTKTTGTSNLAEAKERRWPIISAWKAQFQAIRAGKLEDATRWREDVAALSRSSQETLNQRLQSIFSSVRKQRATAPIDLSFFTELEPILVEMMEHGLHQQVSEFGEVMLEYLDSLEKGLPDSISAAGLAQKVSNAFQKLGSEALIASYSLSPQEIEEARSIRANPDLVPVQSPITDTRLAKFKEFRVSNGLPAKTVDQQESKLKKLSQFLKTESLELNTDSIGSWLDSLGLSSKTKAQYLLAGNTFWKWAMKHDSAWRQDFKEKANPFENHDLPKLRGKAKAETERLPFTPEDVEKIYKHAKSKGNDRLCMLIQLGAYTGCRIEELCRLRTESIVAIEGVESFKIEDSKTRAGIRSVPIHSHIKPLVNRLAANTKDGYLIPTTSNNKYGNRSDGLSKAFGRLKQELSFGKAYVFHSIRKTVITQLQRQDVPGILIAELVGHETGTVTFDVYSAGHSEGQKSNAIEKLAFKLT